MHERNRMENKKTIVISLALFITTLVVVIFCIILFQPKVNFVNIENINENLNIAKTPSEESNNNNNTAYGSGKKYKISYKIQPKVSFGDNNSEIISFDTFVDARSVISYGTTPNYGLVQDNPEYKTHHEIVLKNLDPNTLYYYSVNIYSDNGGFNEEYSSRFITKSSIRYKYNFGVMGDNRPVAGFVMPKEFHELVQLMAREKVSFGVIVGDMVQLSDIETITDNDAQTAWKNFTDAILPISASMPVYLAVGNHDEPANPVALSAYREVWTFPRNGGGKPGWYDETTYWFDYSHSLFIVLNSEEPGYAGGMSPEQFSWLKKILSLGDYEHKFIFTHRPITGSKRGVNDKSSELHKLFLSSGVSAVFTGHDHLYCKYQKDGLYYVITGGGGSPLYKDACLGKEISQYHFLNVEIEGDTITISAVNNQNATIDSFSFTDKKI